MHRRVFPDAYRADAIASTAGVAGVEAIVAASSAVETTQHAADSTIVGVYDHVRTYSVLERQLPHASRYVTHRGSQEEKHTGAHAGAHAGAQTGAHGV
jgi:hypothetical protein